MSTSRALWAPRAWAAAGTLLFGWACSRSSSPSSNGGDPPATVARLSSVTGKVEFEAPGSDAWSSATPNYTITSGDRLYASPGGRGELEADPSAIRFGGGPETDLTVTSLTNSLLQLGLAQGNMDATLYDWNPASSAEFDTPNGALIPRGAGLYRVTVDPVDQATVVSVERGSLQITGPGIDQTVGAGQTVRLTGTNPIQWASVSPPGATGLDLWSDERDRRYAVPSPAAQYVSEDIPGWADLAGYGNWLTDPTYGPVWYPSDVPSDWAPYRDGHWAWEDPWGWTWVDDEPWGFAPFHYGRWVHARSRWAWVPGPADIHPVYAPALVSFVDGAPVSGTEPSDVAAWFPLAPGEPYFPWYHHSDRYLRDVNLTNMRNVQNVDPIIHPRNVDDIPWANRRDALTAVPAPVFSHGDAVARAVLRVDPQQMARTRIAPHPDFNPDASMAMGGPPAPQPPVAARPAMVTRDGRRFTPSPSPSPSPSQPPERRGLAQRPAGGEVSQPLPAIQPHPFVAPNPPRVRPGQPFARSAPPPPSPAEVRNLPAPPPRAPRELITRTAPQPQPPPFESRAEAMQQHPGRPLEPQQMQNIRTGRPPGAMRDQEFPPHPAPAPQPRAQQPPQQQPQRPPVQAAPPPPPAQRAAPAQARPTPKPQPDQRSQRGRRGQPQI